MEGLDGLNLSKHMAGRQCRVDDGQQPRLLVVAAKRSSLGMERVQPLLEGLLVIIRPLDEGLSGYLQPINDFLDACPCTTTQAEK